MTIGKMLNAVKRFEEAQERLESALDKLQKGGTATDPYHVCITALLLARAHLGLDQPDSARALLTESLEALDASGRNEPGTRATIESLLEHAGAGQDG